MSLELLTAFLLFAAVMLFTPGPNNIMLMSSGLNFDFARTLPHMLGVSLGFGLMVFLVGRIYPALYTLLKYAGATYLLYLAWAIGTSGKIEEVKKKSRPLTFLEGAAFQWITPRAGSSRSAPSPPMRRSRAFRRTLFCCRSCSPLWAPLRALPGPLSARACGAFSRTAACAGVQHRHGAAPRCVALSRVCGGVALALLFVIAGLDPLSVITGPPRRPRSGRAA
jgi:LysE type translocator